MYFTSVLTPVSHLRGYKQNQYFSIAVRDTRVPLVAQVEIGVDPRYQKSWKTRK
jgi:hypothetical protein